MFRPHIRSAEIGAHTILLDLTRNKYFAATTQNLKQALQDRSATNSTWVRLSSAGLVDAEPLEAERLARPHLRLWSAFLWSARQVRRGRLDLTFNELARRKVASGGAGALIPAGLCFYRAWRPWYPAPIVCLFDSLALMKFMLAIGAPGTMELVLGVRGMPFEAHCWLECAGNVLNDDAMYCAAFKEIARV